MKCLTPIGALLRDINNIKRYSASLSPAWKKDGYDHESFKNAPTARKLCTVFLRSCEQMKFGRRPQKALLHGWRLSSNAGVGLFASPFQEYENLCAVVLRCMLRSLAIHFSIAFATRCQKSWQPRIAMLSVPRGCRIASTLAGDKLLHVEM